MLLSLLEFIVVFSYVLTLCYALPAGNGNLSKGRNPPSHVSTLSQQLLYHVDTRNRHEAKASSKWTSKKNKNAHLEEASFHDKKVQEIGSKLYGHPKPLTPEQEAKADQRHEKIRQNLALARGHVIP